jgi:alpha-glucuronidase
MRQSLHIGRVGIAAQISLGACLIAGVAPALRAESGYDAWLRYAPLPAEARERDFKDLPAVVVPLGDSPIVQSAAEELVRGLSGMTGRTLRVEKRFCNEPMFVLGESSALVKFAGNRSLIQNKLLIKPDGFEIGLTSSGTFFALSYDHQMCMEFFMEFSHC